ncbi:c-type cytochrome [Massilia sp. S19_KUP03_FR1]|uniref:c-type cytochrome n=1 Tax=Massilia sp. S19_KUP03_FR1 TaxID=3025503 RepID=UPI002FCDC0CB
MMARVSVLFLLVLGAGAHAAPADLVAGKAAFQKCASCHAVGPYARGGYAPQLNGIVGRRAGSTTDFAYSAVLKNANFSWSEQNLAGFLRAPSEFIPGNKMRFWGISDQQQIVNLIGYMKTFTAALVAPLAPPAPANKPK